MVGHRCCCTGGPVCHCCQQAGCPAASTSLPPAKPLRPRVLAVRIAQHLNSRRDRVVGRLIGAGAVQRQRRARRSPPGRCLGFSAAVPVRLDLAGTIEHALSPGHLIRAFSWGESAVPSIAALPSSRFGRLPRVSRFAMACYAGAVPRPVWEHAHRWAMLRGIEKLQRRPAISRVLLIARIKGNNVLVDRDLEVFHGW